MSKALVYKELGRWTVETMGFKFTPVAGANSWSRAVFLATNFHRIIPSQGVPELGRGHKVKVMGFDGVRL